MKISEHKRALDTKPKLLVCLCWVFGAVVWVELSTRGQASSTCVRPWACSWVDTQTQAERGKKVMSCMYRCCLCSPAGTHPTGSILYPGIFLWPWLYDNSLKLWCSTQTLNHVIGTKSPSYSPQSSHSLQCFSYSLGICYFNAEDQGSGEELFPTQYTINKK